MKSQTNTRQYLGNPKLDLPVLDLIGLQKDSYQLFLNKDIRDLLSEVSPIEDFTGKNWELSFGQHRFSKPRYSPQQALEKDVSFEASLKVETILLNKRTGKSKKAEVFLGDIPQMTPTGTFIVNGIERVVINQIIRAPGAYFSGGIDRSSGRMLYTAEIRPLRGSWLEFFVNRDNSISVRIDRRRKFPVTVFLRALGLSEDQQILEAFGIKKSDDPAAQYIYQTLEKDGTTNVQEALLEIYQKIRPGEPSILENATELFEEMFANPRRYTLGKVGRFKLNKKLARTIPNEKSTWLLQTEDVLKTIGYLINLQEGNGNVDDIDHLSNRRIRQVGELVSESVFRSGLLRLERSIKEKMSLTSIQENPSPVQLVNARPLIAAINEFFRSNQLSQILDQTNPLQELDNLRRASVFGTGGISRERASFSIRDINASQYGRICPVRTPEGPNIGLVTYLAMYTQVNEYGFLETPYRRVEKVNGKMKVSNKIVYLPADDEVNHYITHTGINIDEDNFIKDSWVPVRYQNEFLEARVNKVEFIDASPRQVVGVSASLIPFLANDSPNRALMGTHMQCQAVPLVTPEAPVVGTGTEGLVPRAMGRVIQARHDGKITFVDANKIILRIKPGQDKDLDRGLEETLIRGNQEVYYLSKFKRTNPYGSCYSQKPLVEVGEQIKKGDILADGPSCDKGELALGKNLTVAYCGYDGFEYEDAIIVSDRLVRQDLLTSIHIGEYEAAVVETKLGPEELTKDLPNTSDTDLAKLAEDGIVVVGSEVGPNDILVGKIAPKGETELTAEERLLRAIFGEKAREIRDTSLRMPHGERGTVIGVQIFDRDKGDELEPGTISKIVVKLAQERKIKVGDKLAGRHGNKGVISKIVAQEDMPFLPDGTPVDVVISPLSVLSRMNLGQLFETHLGWAADKLGQKFAVPVFEEIAEEYIIGQLKKAGLPADGKVVLQDGRTGKPYDYPSVVGVGYILKLVHMVEDKTHARSTGPYSLVTQQPLGGKAQMGGQRLGEMEVWALESHRAAHTLQEMLTIKSDDIVGRARAFEAIVKDKDIPAASVPESFKVLRRELESLGLEIELLDPVELPVEDEEKVEKKKVVKKTKKVTKKKEEKA